MVAVEANNDGELAPGTQVLRRYSVVGKLAQGGMAEVYLSRQVGPAGYSKLVVIKRVRPHLANDADFVGMFVNEARLAAMINHPNVVQIFDLGDEPRPGGGQDWLLAMEYLDGRDMLQVGRACRAHNKAVPFDVTARIIADACAGLDHAHQLRGPDGKSLDLVHRDMSPENVLITFEGQVKVVDFGIAKASDNLIKTQAGQIKGKLGYVAPEAILGKSVDARADVFAIGATLYLFLSGRPAFTGSNPMEIFERSLKPPTPTREVNSRVPEALDAICMKALAQDRDKRYRSAGEVRAALDAYLQSTGRPLGPVQLSQFMRILFPPDKDPVRQRIDKLLADAPPPTIQTTLQMATAQTVAARDNVPKPEPIYVDDDKTNIVPPRDLPVPEPVTIQTATVQPARPAHLRSMGVAGVTSQPSGIPVDLTNEDMTRPKGGAPTVQVSQPSASLPSIEIGDDIDLDDIAAAISDDDDDGPTVRATKPPQPTLPRQATLTNSVADLVSVMEVSSSSGDLGPPPFEPSGAVERPAVAPEAPAPPPAFAIEPAPAEQFAAQPQPEPAFDMQPQMPAAPMTLPPELLSQSGPGAGLKLAMFAFGFLTGALLILAFLWMTGQLSRLFS